METAWKRIRKKLEAMGVAYEDRIRMDTIRRWEEKYHVVLPEELVMLYCEVCSGCAMIDGFRLKGIEEWEIDENRIQQPFPFQQYWIWEEDHQENRLIQTQYGNIELLDMGDSQSWHIIVDGPQRGQMWFFTDVGIQPCASPKNVLEWFECWLDGKEDYFEAFQP